MKIIYLCKGVGELTPVSYGEARAVMMNTVDADGKILGIVPEYLLVPPGLKPVAESIVEASELNGMSNPWKDSALVFAFLGLVQCNWFLFTYHMGQTLREGEVMALCNFLSCSAVLKQGEVLAVEWLTSGEKSE